MDSQLYIPKKLKVGFVKREDTYNGNLAYLIYYDDKGVLRKEKSWEGWRDKAIEPKEFDNTPIDGFVINKSLRRYNWGHFSSNRTMIRIFDSRGFEFEITPENLIGILMNGDCLRRGFEGKFVYAWAGTDLVLLPANSEEYEKATVYTKLQAGKVGARDLVPGCVYRTKKQEDLIYLGKMDWFEKTYKKGPNPLSVDEWMKKQGYGSYYRDRYPDKVDVETREGKKQYIFVALNSPTSYTHVAGLTFLANRLTDTPVQNFAELMQNFESNVHSRGIASVSILPPEKEEWVPVFDHKGEYKAPYYGRILPSYSKTYYVDMGDGVFCAASIDARNTLTDGVTTKQWYYTLSSAIKFNPERGVFDRVYMKNIDTQQYNREWESRILTEDQIERNVMKFGILCAKLTNGNTARIRGDYYI